MITFELIAFIKKHLQRDTPTETIKSLLTERGGWYSADIEEAFLIAIHGEQIYEGDE